MIIIEHTQLRVLKEGILSLLIILLMSGTSVGQFDAWLQSIHQDWQNATHDTTRVLVMAQYANYYKFHRPDSAIIYSTKAIDMATKIGFPRGRISAMRYLAISYDEIGNYSRAIKVCLEGFDLAKKNDIVFDQALFKAVEGYVYIQIQDYVKAYEVLSLGLKFTDQIRQETGKELPLANIIRTRIGQAYLESNQIDSADHYISLALQSASENKEAPFPLIRAQIVKGDIEAHRNRPIEAISYYRKTLAPGNVEPRQRAETLLSIAIQYSKLHLRDSAIINGQRSLAVAKGINHHKSIERASLFLANSIEESDKVKSLEYLRLAYRAQDDLNNTVNNTALQTINEFELERQRAEVEAIQTQTRNKLRTRTLLGSLLTLALFSFFMFRANRRKQQANSKIEKAYSDLKSTQAQLLHSEKMASLGELTAGIAHEIQNPLNFVNNFSDVSGELITDLKDEINNGDLDEAKAIADDLIQNLAKINHHGSRASSIVQGMIAHSHSGSGTKEPTDINKIVDEYLRLAYQGLRAKDKEFQAEFKSELDPNLPLVNVVAQDMGRVILNLINNAFYTVNKKKINIKESEFRPTINVSTSQENGHVIIRVKDNGQGMSLEIAEKIFQPFFTTKPTGEGTGLGLSLSYDIVTKGHGGTLEVESEEGVGTVFVIRIPIR